MRSFIFKITQFILVVGFMTICFSCDSGGDKLKTIQNPETDPVKPARIEFDSTVHYLGKLTEGEQAGWYFYFRNTGSNDLVIYKATSSCGCTVPEFSREPVPPGEQGKIQVVYDSSGRSGFDSKTVKVESNAENSLVKLKIEVEVVKKSNT